ncbi:MAG: Gfo/Idh/MocA family protein [Promethearchaeota archaeon]
MDDKIINVGFIGYGAIAKVHIERILKFPNISINAIYSRSDKSGQIPKDIRFYRDYHKLIQKENLDAIFICTPTYTHKEIACECSEAGIDIFLEKPMAITLDDCYSIIDSIKSNKNRLFMGHVLRFWPTYGSVQKFISENKNIFGELFSLELKRLSTFPCSPWFADQKKSGGVILDLAIHDIDYAIWLCKMPKTVKCKARKIKRYNKKVYGDASIYLEFEKDDIIANCEASWSKPTNFKFYTYAKLKSKNYELEFDAEKIYKSSSNLGIKNVFESEDGYLNQLIYFFNILKDKNKKFNLSWHEGLQAVKICLAAIQSAKNNGKEIILENFE